MIAMKIVRYVLIQIQAIGAYKERGEIHEVGDREKNKTSV
jgi:hypothetical protein